MALGSLKASESGAAWVLEEVGDRAAALHFAESAYTHATTYGKDVPSSRADTIRLLWLIAGQSGDYRRFYDGANPSREQILADVAYGWRRRADSMEIFGGPVADRLEAAGRAVELSRRLAAGHASGAEQLGLAFSLRSEGGAFRSAARFSTGSESVAAYQRSRALYQESFEILQSFRNSDRLSGAGKALMFTLANDLADNAERLRSSTLPQVP